MNDTCMYIVSFAVEIQQRQFYFNVLLYSYYCKGQFIRYVYLEKLLLHYHPGAVIPISYFHAYCWLNYIENEAKHNIFTTYIMTCQTQLHIFF